MSTIFPKWMNALPTAAVIGAGVLSVGVVSAVWYYFTPEFWEVGYMPDQPVDYSHQIHVGKLGIDCRYCHTHVEEAGFSNVPDTQTCMACHTGEGATGYLSTQLWNAHKENPNLVALRTAYASGEPIEWKKIHKLPDYAHFNHAAHINAGVSCYSCHGRIDQMEVVYQTESLSMGWCLDCHREPEVHLVDVSGILEPNNPVRITDLGRVAKLLDSPEQRARGEALARAKQITAPESCAACHY